MKFQREDSNGNSPGILLAGGTSPEGHLIGIPMRMLTMAPGGFANSDINGIGVRRDAIRIDGQPESASPFDVRHGDVCGPRVRIKAGAAMRRRVTHGLVSKNNWKKPRPAASGCTTMTRERENASIARISGRIIERIRFDGSARSTRFWE